MSGDLFDDPRSEPWPERLAAGTMLLHRFALADAAAILAALAAIVERAPFRHMLTPGGQRMSVALTNCGALGWVSDASGYRYASSDPQSGRPWPALPVLFRQLANGAAAAAGFPDFSPDACLINRYVPASRLSLHQDRNERDFAAPIVSFSLGLPAVFLWGGLARSDKVGRLLLSHGDVLVWGGPDRLRYHGVMPLADAVHPALGKQRINLTFRKAG